MVVFCKFEEKFTPDHAYTTPLVLEFPFRVTFDTVHVNGPVLPAEIVGASV